jgi:succinate dehydrogenase/fumarate reductase iron-sulfur protein
MASSSEGLLGEKEMNSETSKTVTFKIQRYNPEQKKHYQSIFKVPVRKGITLLDGLLYIQDNLDDTLAFRHSCRMGICGSCAIIVNGKPMLACYTQILHLDSVELTLEPLQNMPIIKDLIVDIQPFFNHYKEIKNTLIKPKEAFNQPKEFTQKPAELKKYWDLSLCIKCSICYSACPAAIDQKFLGPSAYTTNYRFISDTRDEGQAERLKPISDNLWLCTSCNSCTMFCPKEIECSSSIVDERELLVETGDIPRTAKEVLTSVIRYHNPMGMHPNKRINWSDDMTVNTYPTVKKADVLWFVGCAPAYDQRSQSIAKSMVSTMNKMGTNFATLGTEEWCCGDHIQRMGERGLFLMLAEQNISTFEKFQAQKILTISPHCFNTFKNDSPYADKQLNVQHYTQFFAQALETGKLQIKSLYNKKITYHDPCFLGKRNEIYEPPRQILNAISSQKLIEMKRTRESSFCCGGGAGRTWTEEADPDKRPSVNRIKEAVELGVEVITTACPFCVTTLEDAMKVLDYEDKIEVKDILEILDQVS